MRRFVCVRGRRERAAEVIMQSEIGGSFFPRGQTGIFFFGREVPTCCPVKLTSKCPLAVTDPGNPQRCSFLSPPQRACTVKNRMKIIEKANAFCSFHRFKLYLSICVTEDRHILFFFFFFLIMTWPRIVSEYETVAGSVTLVPVVDWGRLNCHSESLLCQLILGHYNALQLLYCINYCLCIPQQRHLYLFLRVLSFSQRFLRLPPGAFLNFFSPPSNVGLAR